MTLRELIDLIYRDIDRQRLAPMSDDQAKALASYLARNIRAAVMEEKRRLREVPPTAKAEGRGLDPAPCPVRRG